MSAYLGNPPIANYRELLGVKTVRKLIDQTINNSATLTNDAALFYYMRANERWYVLTNIKLSLQATSDFKFIFTVPAGATFVGNQSSAASTAAEDALTTQNTILTAAPLLCSLRIAGQYVGGTTAGYLRFQWAQNTATAENTIVLANSTLILIRTDAG